MLKLLLSRPSHPFAVVRAAELRRWVDSGDYTRVLGGDYPRRDADDDAKVSEAAQEAARSYSETFRQTQDALGRLVHDLAGLAGSAKLWLDEKLRRRRPVAGRVVSTVAPGTTDRHQVQDQPDHGQDDADRRQDRRCWRSLR